jgi:hypothetical protein
MARRINLCSKSRRAIWISVILIVALFLQAQPVSAGSGFHYGAKAGLNGAWITASGSDPRFDFVGGVFATIPLSDRFSIQPEVLYTRKGGKDSQLIPYIELNLTADFRFEYIEVPLLLRYSFGTDAQLSPYLYAGPSIGLNLSSNVRLETELGQAQIDIVNMKSTDVGLAVGGGTDVALRHFSLVFDLRLTVGLGNFLQASKPFVDDENVAFVREDGSPPDLENGSVSFTVGVAF